MDPEVQVYGWLAPELLFVIGYPIRFMVGRKADVRNILVFFLPKTCPVSLCGCLDGMEVRVINAILVIETIFIDILPIYAIILSVRRG